MISAYLRYRNRDQRQATRRSRGASGFLFLFLVFLALSNTCCYPGSARLGLEGMVTFDNEPLNQGYLTFQPEPDTPGPSTAADIVEGNFSIPSQMEVLPGTFRIQIEFHRPSGEKQKKPRNGELFEVQEQFIPARYNSASTLTVEVKNNQRNRFEFTLVNE